MKRMLMLLLVVTGVGVHGQAQVERTRRFYMSATDAKGAPITDLTAADLTVKEGGKERPIASLAPATAPMHIALLVEDAGSGGFQSAVAQFVQSTAEKAKLSIRLLDPRAIKLCDYTQDANTLQTAVERLGRIGRLGRIQGDGEYLLDAILETAKELQKLKAERPLILALTVRGETRLVGDPLQGTASSDDPDAMLTQLRNSGVALNAIYLTRSTTGRFLSDGPKQSGGMGEAVGNSEGIAPALAKILNSVTHQYEVAYTLPAGVKLDARLAVATSRKGVTLIAPTRIPDK